MEEYTCECTADITTFTYHTKLQHAQLLEPHSTAEVLSAQWRGLVSEYSTLSITFPSDLLPALMGVAKPMLDLSPTRIIAGCWESFLLHDMLWTAQYRYGRGEKKSETIAPSWSWLSTPSSVSYRYTENSDATLHATLHDIEVDASKGIDDTFIWSASLSISAYMIPVILGYNLSHSSDRYIAPDIDSKGKHLRWTAEPDKNYFSSYGLEKGDRLYCMWMATLREKTDFGILLQCLDEEKNVYRRVAAVSHRLEEKLGETIAAQGKMTRFTFV